MKSKLTVYVGCALSHASDEFKKSVELFKKKLGTIVNVLDFKGEIIGTAREVYLWDIHECVYKCDFMVAICDLPSTGLGYEMATQIEKREKPLLAIAQKESVITRLILDTGHPQFTFRRYDDLMTDGFEMVKAEIENIIKTK